MLHFLVKTLVNYSVLQALRPEQVVAVHIDNGFMRKNESQEVEESLKRLGLRLKGNFGLYYWQMPRSVHRTPG